MKKYLIKTFVLSTVLISQFVTAGIIYPDPQVGLNAAQYGDFYSYSLPISAYQYDLVNGGGVNEGNPFYVQSSPGQIKDLIVVATGAGGQAQTNIDGMDNAYETPNSSGIVEFSTKDYSDPTGDIFTGDLDTTWDIEVSTLMDYLDGEEMYFYFNNNQANSGDAIDQSLFAAGQIFLSGNGVDDVYFDFLNNGGLGPIFGFQGSDVEAYTSSGAFDWDNFDDFVLSGGQVCTNVDVTAFLACDAVGAVLFNHNLGANQAAYAIYSPELMLALNSGNYDAMHIDIKFTGLNNGYEQLFIASASQINEVPEPTGILLLSIGGLMLIGISELTLLRK